MAHTDGMDVYRRVAATVFSHEGALQVRLPADNAKIRLEGTALRIWELLEYPITAERLCSHLAGEYSADGEELAAEVGRFLAGLRARNLIEVLGSVPTPAEENRHRYLWTLKRALVNLLYPEHELRIRTLMESPGAMDKLDQARFFRDIRYRAPDRFVALTAAKQDGRIPGVAPLLFPHTLIGLQRLENLERCAEQVFDDGVPGDFIEAGACQGGAAIFLRALQVVFGQAHRRTWVADSFQGPPPAESEADLAYGVDFPESRCPVLAVSLDAVRDNFLRYDLLDDGVCFLPGWFSDTLAGAPIDQLAILRVDADLYQSTREVLESLYAKVSPGGFVIVDDYGSFPSCRQAVDEFRARHGVHEPLQQIDWEGVYWRKMENALG